MARITGNKINGNKVGTLTDQHDNPTQYIYCPACKTIHTFDDRWTFNNNYDKPTFSPSMLANKDSTNPKLPRCHSFVTDGKIRYLGDCTHEMKNQTIELPDHPDKLW